MSCYEIDNLSDKKMVVILKERNRRARSKNLYPEKSSKSKPSETSLLFATNPN